MEGTTKFMLPRRGRGRRSDADEARYQAELDAFCEMILEINSKTGISGEFTGLVLHLGERGRLTQGRFRQGPGPHHRLPEVRQAAIGYLR
jgi:hypothetical protein